MFPFADSTKTYSIPIWVILIIIANAVVYFLSITGGNARYLQMVFEYGTIPVRFFMEHGAPFHVASGDLGDVDLSRVNFSQLAPPIVTLFTSIFLHGGVFHLLGNMWFFWIFGDNVEDRMGKFIFPIFYLVCGVAAGLTHVYIMKNSDVPAIGASGAIAGVMGAYLFMFPRATVRTLIGIGCFWRIISISAVFYLAVWFVFQLLPGIIEPGATQVAVWAHVGGFVTGLVLAMILSWIRLINWYPGDRGSKAAPESYYDYYGWS